jgi:hypothetical protein
MPDKIRYSTVTIGAGASLSDALTIPAGYTPIAVITAATWDAAKIAFQLCVDGTNYFVLKEKGTEYETASVTAAAWVTIDPDLFLGARKLKVQSGISTAATNQADATIVTVVMYGVGA